MKKPLIAFTIADNKNMPMAKKFLNNLRKFHTEEELPFIIIDEEKIKSYKDPYFFYRATPIIAKELIKDYELVLKLDCDQICLGNLSHIWEHNDYDVGTVLNINRVDPARYGFITTYVIDPQEYYNAGLVAMKSEGFVNRWYELCHSKYFDRLQFREQDLLNILCHFGNWKVKCFDRYDQLNDVSAWWGLIAKGETMKMVKNGDNVVLPKGADNYPDRDVLIKLFHYAGGGNEPKNHTLIFPEELVEYINYLQSGGDNEKDRQKA